MDLAAYRKERADKVSDENALNQLAEYYDEITYDVVNQIFVIEKDGKFNFIYESDKVFPPAVYDFCHLYPGFAVVRKGCQVGNLFFHEGLSEPASYRNEHVFEVKCGKYFGVETAFGDTLLPCEYTFVKVYPNFILTISDEGFSLFHTDGRRMFDEYFDDIDLSERRDDYIYAQKNECWGVVHLHGHWIVPDIFRDKNDILPCEDYASKTHYFECSLHDNDFPFDYKKGLYDIRGQLIIPFEYEYRIENDFKYVDYCGNHFRFPLIVKKNDNFGLIDRRGTIIFPCNYDEITTTNDGYYNIRKKGMDNIWYIPDVIDFFTSKIRSENFQLIETSCFDFLKMYCLTHWMEDIKENVRWGLINVACYGEFARYFGFLAEYFREINPELSYLFELVFLRKDLKTHKINYDDSQNEFSSSYILAGIYFEGKRVKANYQYAFELYENCLDVIHRKYNVKFHTIYEKLISILSESSEKILLVDDDELVFEMDYQECAIIAFRMGWMLYTGNGVEKDKKTGMALLSAAQKSREILSEISKNDNSIFANCPF